MIRRGRHNAGRVRQERVMNAIRKLERCALSGVGLLLEAVIQGLVDCPDHVSVLELVGEQGTLLEVAVHPEDFGRVIGRGGRNIGAIRELLFCLSAKERHEYLLVVVDPMRGSR